MHCTTAEHDAGWRQSDKDQQNDPRAQARQNESSLASWTTIPTLFFST